MKSVSRILFVLIGFSVLNLVLAQSKDDRVLENTTPANPGNSVIYGHTPKEYLPYGNFTQPYRQFLGEPLQYRGYGRRIPEPDLKDLKSIRLGFLGPIEKTVSVATGGASHEQALGRKMLWGAQLAIDLANAAGGYRDSGLPFELMVHNDNGLWGASGNEIINMAYKEKVWGILGSIDGANSHIAIRVALKCEVPVVNSGDTDPTFVETSIPWVFRCIADDRNMCYLLADFAYKKLGLKRIAALRANNRYGRISIDEFRDASTRLGHPFIAELNYVVGSIDFTPQLHQIAALDPDGIITYGNAMESALILKQMREMGLSCWFFGSDRMVDPVFEQTVPEKDLHHIAAGFPYNPNSQDPQYLDFVEKFKAAYGFVPETYAAHAYDGMKMLIQAVEKAGLNRALIRDELARMQTFEGVTGLKEFDPVFSNISPAYLAVWGKKGVDFFSRSELLGNLE